MAGWQSGAYTRTRGGPGWGEKSVFPGEKRPHHREGCSHAGNIPGRRGLWVQTPLPSCLKQTPHAPGGTVYFHRGAQGVFQPTPRAPGVHFEASRPPNVFTVKPQYTLINYNCIQTIKSTLLNPRPLQYNTCFNRGSFMANLGGCNQIPVSGVYNDGVADAHISAGDHSKAYGHVSACNAWLDVRIHLGDGATPSCFGNFQCSQADSCSDTPTTTDCKCPAFWRFSPWSLYLKNAVIMLS